ncbi:hypothetical protein M438DRAFT_38156 [Aureobasidium pullulans EXF-150]|uniref:Uncharacterized protein n=1 Tax=Aureobasidium pullulans EXF-150 TaxID=1043002 RepID=A0A074XJ37_AURPU|nr:uncharacterized protein M438DRAFT_38156 [Aureobasidium pullulans EXF-150]KEQ83664.1 hypothetical protein M438DRAFT_38156 [Aureobasidium pullulans EXF-150]
MIGLGSKTTNPPAWRRYASRGPSSTNTTFGPLECHLTLLCGPRPAYWSTSFASSCAPCMQGACTPTPRMSLQDSCVIAPCHAFVLLCVSSQAMC